MAARTNPSGNQYRNSNGSSSFNGVGSGGGNSSNGKSVSATENSGRARALKHNPGLSAEWTTEEQTILEEWLSKYASWPAIIRYLKIAMQLQDKTVRDVTLRCRSMNEKVTDSSVKPLAHMASQPNAPPNALPMIPIDNDDGISFKAIGGATGQLLEQNAQMLNQISANFASFQIQDNINLLRQTRDNIHTILNDLNEPGIMKKMPPLPVKINEELLHSLNEPGIMKQMPPLPVKMNKKLAKSILRPK